MKINAPDKSFTGDSRYGSLVLKFKDGEAELDGDLPDAVRGYMVRAGYGIDEPAPEPKPAPKPTVHDAERRVGTPLADAPEKPKGGRGRKAAETPEEAPDAPEGQDN